MTGLICIKTYGIHKNCKGRYAVTTDISEDKSQYNASFYCTYVKPEFALQKAEQTVRRMYKDFVNFQGVPIHFEFRNMDLIT